MRVRAKCSCGWSSLSEISSVGLLTQCPVCGKCVSTEPEPLADAGSTVVRKTKPAETLPARSHHTPTAAGAKKGNAVGKAERPCLLSIAAMTAALLSVITVITANLYSFSSTRRLVGPASIILALVLASVGVAIGTVVLLKKMPGRRQALFGVVDGGVMVIGMLAVITFILQSGNTWWMWGGPVWGGPAAVVAPASPSTFAAASQPSVLGGQEITDALTAPLSMQLDADGADARLNLALNLYSGRREYPWKLAGCVKYFREYLARTGLAEPANAEHATMFRNARDELIDRVLLAYRRAGQLEQSGKWKEAKDAYGEMREFLSEGPVYENVIEHRRWCLRKEIESEAKGTR